MGTGLIGSVQLANGERVFVTWLVRPMEEWLRRRVSTLRTARIPDADGHPIEHEGRLVSTRHPTRTPPTALRWDGCST
jgi:hypothetical protein